MSDVASHRSPLERFLGLFTEVRAGEGPITLLMALNVFLLLTSYYLIKPVRDGLILAAASAETKAYLVGAMAAVLFFLVGGYAKLVSRYERTRLITVVTSAFIACLVVFWALSRMSVPYLGYVFFVWIGIFNVMVVAQFWSYANDVYINESGKRLFPLVAFGGSVGALAGTSIAKLLLRFISLFEMLLVSGAVLGVCIVLTNVISRKVWGKAAIEARQRELTAKAQRKDAPGPKQKESLGFDMLFRYKYIGLIALLVLLLNLVNTTGGYIMDVLVVDHGEATADEVIQVAVASGSAVSIGGQQFDPTSADARDEIEGTVIASFYAEFYFWVNLLGVFLQLFVVGRLVKYFGIKAGLLWLPIIALGTYALILIAPVLRFARIGKTAENASDYSVNKTTIQMLFLPTTHEIKYKAKQVTDSFMQRIGDVGSAIIVFVGTAVFTFGARGFAGLNLGMILVWLVVVLMIVREHAEIEKGNRPEISGAPDKAKILS
jgi:AAA family ATP:ADP antiporter